MGSVPKYCAVLGLARAESGRTAEVVTSSCPNSQHCGLTSRHLDLGTLFWKGAEVWHFSRKYLTCDVSNQHGPQRCFFDYVNKQFTRKKLEFLPGHVQFGITLLRLAHGRGCRYVSTKQQNQQCLCEYEPAESEFQISTNTYWNHCDFRIRLM